MEYKGAFIITTVDTGCIHSWTVSDFDADIVVPHERKTYQYLIKADSDFEEQIIAARILEELYKENVKNCSIQVIDIRLSQRMKMLLECLASNNKIRI
jgi:hypothetical protein